MSRYEMSRITVGFDGTSTAIVEWRDGIGYVPKTVVAKGRRWLYQSMPNWWQCGDEVMADEVMSPLLRRRRAAMRAAYRRKKRGHR